MKRCSKNIYLRMLLGHCELSVAETQLKEAGIGGGRELAYRTEEIKGSFKLDSGAQMSS